VAVRPWSEKSPAIDASTSKQIILTLNALSVLPRQVPNGF
jgi:hypothetical protein